LNFQISPTWLIQLNSFSTLNGRAMPPATIPLAATEGTEGTVRFHDPSGSTSPNQGLPLSGEHLSAESTSEVSRP